MSDKSKIAEQLTLPFDGDRSRTPSAQIISLIEHRQRADGEKAAVPELTQEAEQKILDRVLERAERLTWYK